MWKFLVLAIFVVAVSAYSTPRHLYQVNQMNVFKEEPSIEGRIVGGTDRTIEQHPYQVAMLRFLNHRCGGSVLNTNTFLSAAHCTFSIPAAELQILAGQTLNSNTATAQQVAWLTEHPAYDDWTLENDIVILRTVGHFVLGPNIVPANLPTPGTDVASGRIGTVSGWGTMQWGTTQFPEILQAVDVPFMTNAECQAIYANQTILPIHICAGEYGADACQGDSGGPLVYEGVQVGIVNWGYFCAFEFPTVYARVSEYLLFIATEMARP